MEENKNLSNQSIPLTEEEKLTLKRELIRASVKARILKPGLTFFGLIGVVILFAYGDLLDGMIRQFLLFACTISLIYLIVGFAQHLMLIIKN